MNALFSFFKDRLKERSTWTGLALLGGALGVHFDPEHIPQIIETSAEILGAAYIISPDKKKPQGRRPKAEQKRKK